MTTNLFNIFDPSTMIFNFEINWISTMFSIMLIPNFLWISPNRIKLMLNKMLIMLNNEMIMLYKNKNIKSPSFLFISLFMFILMNNFLGLFPYIFSSSSHMIFSLTLAMPFWMFFIILSMIKNTKNMIIHLIPMNTPIYLAPLMTLIETTSIIIRPLSLAIRLTANMIAGHLMMTLLNSNYMILFIFIIQMFLMIFELCVTVIQSYVFSILSSLYSSE
uniref:ATP synthase subunit a n=1 Tax=Thripsaphis sp. YW-2015 TaxID=1667253 RepID=A0A1L1YM10_9HEMI|nr:ATP synthase subunit 6 [Thripsaphis sp. YW-2015]